MSPFRLWVGVLGLFVATSLAAVPAGAESSLASAPALATSSTTNPSALADSSSGTTSSGVAGEALPSGTRASANARATHSLNAGSGPTSKVIGWSFNHPDAFASDGTHLWVANEGGNSVTELNLSDGSLVRVIAGSSYGLYFPIALASDGTHLWVANLYDDLATNTGRSVTELNLSDGSLVQVIRSTYAFNFPSSLTSDGTHLWVANSGGNSVTELNLSDGSLVQVISDPSFGFNGPVALIFDGTHLWVVNNAGNSLTELNLTP